MTDAPYIPPLQVIALSRDPDNACRVRLHLNRVPDDGEMVRLVECITPAVAALPEGT